MMIAATRMYRSLVTYFDNFTDLYSDRFLPLSSSSHRGRRFYSVQESEQRRGAAPVLTVTQAHVAHIPLNAAAAAPDCTACTQHSKSPESKSRRDSSFGTDTRQVSLKPNESTFEEDLERGVDN
jgi:hypothetical protein